MTSIKEFVISVQNQFRVEKKRALAKIEHLTKMAIGKDSGKAPVAPIKRATLMKSI